jgi:hypothetical protein
MDHLAHLHALHLEHLQHVATHSATPKPKTATTAKPVK